MLITGGSGFLGRHLTHGPATAQWELIAPSSAAMDVRRRQSVSTAIADWKPHAVVHLAYRKGDRPATVDGSRHVAEAAASCGARLVHLSSDVVFPGRLAPYREDDHPRPLTEYGHHKHDAEHAVLDACPTAVVVRTSLLYGTAELATIQLDVRRALTGPDRQPMTFFTDEFRCPAHAADVADAVGQLAQRPEITGPLHVAGPAPLSRADFARVVARWLGLDPAGLQTSTIAESGLTRPARIVLDTSRARDLGIVCRPVDEHLTT